MSSGGARAAAAGSVDKLLKKCRRQPRRGAGRGAGGSPMDVLGTQVPAPKARWGGAAWERTECGGRGGSSSGRQEGSRGDRGHLDKVGPMC